MTNIEKLQEVIKETFPDIFENEPDLKIVTDFCNIFDCGDKQCDTCYLNPFKEGGYYENQKYTGPVKTSNSTTAITSGEISW